MSVSEKDKKPEDEMIEQEPTDLQEINDSVEGEIDLDSLPKEIKQIMAVSYKGPLPPPDMLKKYQDIQPDFPERILRLTEDEADHRRKMSRCAIRFTGAETFLGQFFALVVALSGFVTAGYLGSVGQAVPASVIGGGTLAAMVYAFVTGKKYSSESEEEDE